MTVSTRVRKCREALGLSKAELARLAGFPRATITHVEQRNSDGLSAKTLSKLADALDVSADYLLGRSKNKQVNKQRGK